MGCGGSRLAGGGKPAVFPTRLRPLFLLHTRRPSRKLLMHETDEEESCSVSQKYGTPLWTPLSEEDNGIFGQKYEEEDDDDKEKHGDPKLEIEAGFQKNKTWSRDESEFEDALAEVYEDEDEDEEDKTRMIGHQDDDGAFPGSPTFRYFCKDEDVDDDGDDLGKIYGISSDDDNTPPSKENYNDENKKVKRGRKRRSFKKVLSKGAVKKLFNVKSCYTQSRNHNHNHNHLLLGKAVA